MGGVLVPEQRLGELFAARATAVPAHLGDASQVVHGKEPIEVVLHPRRQGVVGLVQAHERRITAPRRKHDGPRHRDDRWLLEEVFVDVPHRRSIASCRIEHRDVLETRSLILEEFMMLEFAEVRRELNVLFGSHRGRRDGEHAVIHERRLDLLEVATTETGVPVDTRHAGRQCPIELRDLHLSSFRSSEWRPSRPWAVHAPE